MTITTFHKRTLASWSTAPTAYADPPPDDLGIGTEPESPPVYPEENGYTLLDTLMTRYDQGRCVPCGSAAHRSQYCPIVADKLFAPDRCVDCGDVLTVTRCRACAEWGA